jgi:hypothetical protein
MERSTMLSMGKLTISMAIFNSYAKHNQRVYPINIPLNHYKIPLNHHKIPLNPLNYQRVPPVFNDFLANCG